MTTPEAPRLLSVEDNPETRVLLEHLLGDDYCITVVPGTEEALAVLDSDGPFDVLLVDINLGAGREGTELLHEIHAQEDIDELPAIAVTAYAMPGDKKGLLSAGFDGYVGKPFTRAELTDAIEQVL
jgi:CheY-like chemotaxis protein